MFVHETSPERWIGRGGPPTGRAVHPTSHVRVSVAREYLSEPNITMNVSKRL